MKKYKLKDFYGESVVLIPIIRTYQNNGRLAIDLMDEEGNFFTMITINLNDSLSNSNGNLAFVDTNNCVWAEEFITSNKLGIKTKRKGNSGYCEYPEYLFDLTKLNKEETINE